MQAVAGQLTVGATIALTPLYAKVVLRLGSLDWTAAYAFIETAIGVGNLLGGFVIGLLGARIAKGRMVIGGYAVYGLAVVGLGLTTTWRWRWAWRSRWASRTWSSSSRPRRSSRSGRPAT